MNTQENAGNTPSVLSEQLKCGRSWFLVDLKENQIEWRKCSCPDDVSHDASTQSIQSSPLSIELSDCLSVEHSNTTFTLHYAIRKKKKQFLTYRPCAITFTCMDIGTRDTWVQQVRSHIQGASKSRPKRLLVFVNPMSGNKTALKVYKKDVAPILALANIKTDVVETERHLHMKDVLQTYDFSSIDGIVAVGGDGTFSECMNGVLERLKSDQGSSGDDFIKPNIRLGMIGAGSGHLTVQWLTGAYDAVSEAFHIALGGSLDIDVGSVSCDGQHIACGLSVSNGFGSSIAHDSEELRERYGRLRYIVSALKHTINRGVNILETEFLPPDPNALVDSNQEKCSPELERHSEKAACANDQPKSASDAGRWRKIHGNFVDMFTWPTNFSEKYSMPSALMSGNMHIIYTKECSIWQHMRMLREHRDGVDDRMMSSDFIQTADFTSLKVNVIETYRNDGKCIITVDGETFVLPKPKFEINVIKQLLPVFSLRMEAGHIAAVEKASLR